MTEDSLIGARKRAERAVAEMDDGPLKIAAFQTILAKLLTECAPEAQNRHSAAKEGASAKAQPNTISGRILTLKEEGFFKTQQSLGETRRALASRGWHYPLTTLSGAMQRLVRLRDLRRERVSGESKQLWKYSNP